MTPRGATRSNAPNRTQPFASDRVPVFRASRFSVRSQFSVRTLTRFLDPRFLDRRLDDGAAEPAGPGDGGPAVAGRFHVPHLFRVSPPPICSPSRKWRPIRDLSLPAVACVGSAL
jgi:hypothetical protein